MNSAVMFNIGCVSSGRSQTSCPIALFPAEVKKLELLTCWQTFDINSYHMIGAKKEKFHQCVDYFSANQPMVGHLLPSGCFFKFLSVVYKQIDSDLMNCNIHVLSSENYSADSTSA